jgi:tetratricopeptide (TPR) repeat protein
VQMLPFIEINPLCESPMSDDDHALRLMSDTKRIHSHLATFFVQRIFDHFLIRCLLDAGEDPNGIDLQTRNNVLQIRHNLNYLTDHIEVFPASTRFNMLHIVGMMVDYGLTENEWYKFSPAIFTKGITGDSSAYEARHFIEAYIRVIQAQAKNDYALVYKLLSQIHESSHKHSFVENCAGQFAHRFAIVYQHLNKFEEALEWFQKAKQSHQQILISNELVRLCSEWYESLTKNIVAPNFGPWLKLFNNMEILPHNELTATSHYMLGYLYSIVKGFDPVRREECMQLHLNKVTYGPYREAAKRLLEQKTTISEINRSKLTP